VQSYWLLKQADNDRLKLFPICWTSRLNGMRKIAKNFSQDCPGRDLKRKPPNTSHKRHKMTVLVRGLNGSVVSTRSEDGCFVEVYKLLPDYTALQPRRQPSSYSPPWEPQILCLLRRLSVAVPLCFCSVSPPPPSPSPLTFLIMMTIRVMRTADLPL
jgi:hypothetical protein